MRAGISGVLVDLPHQVGEHVAPGPAFGNENSTVSLFRVSPDRKTATRTPVKVGRASVDSIQVLEGLRSGDTVILSDMSRWDSVDRVHLQNQ